MWLDLKKKNETPDEQRKSAQDCFNGAIGLALIPPSLIESTWIDIMDTYTPEGQGPIYIVETYVDRGSSLFSIDLWNVNILIEKKTPENKQSCGRI